MSRSTDSEDVGLSKDSRTGAQEGVISAGPLVGRSLVSSILIVGLPVLLQQLMGATVGLVDKMLAGGLAEEVVVSSMDGLGIGSYVGWFIGIAMVGLGIGGQAIIARAIGRGDVAEAESALGQAMGLSVMWGIFVGFLCWMLAPSMASFCGLYGDSARYLIEYVRILAYAMPFCGVMMVGAMCLAGAGETLRPALIAIAVNIVNVGVSWLLSGAVLRLGPLSIPDVMDLDLGVAGIAAGSACGYVVGGLLTFWVLFRGVCDLKLRFRLISPMREMIARVFRIGIPNFLEGISMWSANLIVLMLIGRIAGQEASEAVLDTSEIGSAIDPMVGEGLAGAHVIAVQWEAFSFLPGFAIGTAAASIAGQYLGAGNLKMARRAVVICTLLAMALMGSLGIVFVFGGESLTSLISDQPRYMTLVPSLLFICGITQIFFAVSMVVRQALRGVGDTVWTFMITTFSCYGIRLPAAWFFGEFMELGLVGVWIGLCGELSIRACLFLARFLHGGWALRKV